MSVSTKFPGLAALGLASLILVGCGGIPHAVIGIDGKTISAFEVPDATRHTVLVATNRMVSEDPALAYSGERGRIKFASVDVFVPPDHEAGQVERADRLPPDPRKHFVALDHQKLDGPNGFKAALRRELAKRPPGKRNVLIFIHGFNTPFDGALYRFTQFVHDTGYQGVPVLFTWPSRAKVTDYLYDLNSALASRDDLLETFRLIGQTNLERGDIMAHSMGNILTVEALRQASIQGRFRKGASKLRYVVLASPDIDVNLFKRQVELLPVDQHEFFVIISQDDKALALSRFLAGSETRVGGATIDDLKDLGVNVVDLTEVDDTKRNHEKFAASPEIVKAIGTRLGADASIDARPTPPAGVRIFQGVLGAPGAILTGTSNVLTGQAGRTGSGVPAP